MLQRQATAQGRRWLSRQSVKPQKFVECSPAQWLCPEQQEPGTQAAKSLILQGRVQYWWHAPLS